MPIILRVLGYFLVMALAGVGSGFLMGGVTGNGDRGIASGIGVFVLSGAWLLFRALRRA